MEKKYIEDTAAYLNQEKRKRILFELYGNAYRTLRSVYKFKHFDEYIRQLASDKQEDKQEIYWNGAYYENLIDYVKICIAFETYNKAVLVENGFIVHKIKKNAGNSAMFNLQQDGQPVMLTDYLNCSKEEYSRSKDAYYLSGFRDSFETINYSTTLNENYQKIIQLDVNLLNNLAELNQKRNRLHFFTDFKSGFGVRSYIEKWQFIKEKSIETLEAKVKP